MRKFVIGYYIFIVLLTLVWYSVSMRAAPHIHAPITGQVDANHSVVLISADPYSSSTIPIGVINVYNNSPTGYDIAFTSQNGGYLNGPSGHSLGYKVRVERLAGIGGPNLNRTVAFSAETPIVIDHSQPKSATVAAQYAVYIELMGNAPSGQAPLSDLLEVSLTDIGLGVSTITIPVSL